MPTTIHEAIVAGIDGPLHPLLFVNRALSDVAQRALLARAAPATERQAQSLLQFLTRRPGLRKLVRQLDVSEIWAVADDRVSMGHRLFARSSRRRVPPTEKQIWDLVTMVGPHLGDITVAVQRGDEFMLDELTDIVVSRGVPRGSDERDVRVIRMGLVHVELLQLRGFYSQGRPYLWRRWPAGRDLPGRSAELIDMRGVDGGLPSALLAGCPTSYTLGVRARWTALDHADAGAHLWHLTVVDSGEGEADRYRQLAACLARFPRLRRLSAIGTAFNEQLASALPARLLRLDVMSMEGWRKLIAPSAALLADVCAGDTLPALQVVVTMAALRSAPLDKACRHRGIRIDYRQSFKVRAGDAKA